MLQTKVAEYHEVLAPTVPLSRHIFKAPTRFYKTGVVFMAWLNGHQDHFVMVGGQQSARNVLHLAELFRLADAAGLLADPPLACARMKQLLATARMRLRKLSAASARRRTRSAPDFREVWDAFFAAQVLVFRARSSRRRNSSRLRASSAGPSRTSSTSSTIPSTPTS